MQARLHLTATPLAPVAQRVRLGLFFVLVLVVGALLVAEIFPGARVFPDSVWGLLARVASWSALAGLSFVLGGGLLVLVGHCLDWLRLVYVVQAGLLKLVTNPPAPIPALARARALRPPISPLI